MTPEGVVKKKLIRWLDEHGAYQFWPVQTGRGKRTVDCLACLASYFAGFECKAYGKRLTALQNHCLHEIARNGGLAFHVTVDANGELLFVPHGSTKTRNPMIIV